MRLGAPLSIEAADRLIAYLELLCKWNRVFNLTAIRDAEQVMTHHLLDSLAVAPHVRGARVLDVGSGAGLPGLVIAIARPELYCTLLDSNGKKTRFLTQACIDLRVANVEVVRCRIEDFHPATAFDCIVSRAFTALGTFIAVAGPLLAGDGELLAMKSVRSAEEMTSVPAGWEARSLELAVPGLHAVRRLVVARRAATS
ncbi:MAG: Ribosomal RNA small subunit methyltransferase G [Gammaproteobacteria bacterium]|nr:Ribosomal RNA small subunit methyltransferase G [Gammaproteobacteria bacterium]